MRKYFVLLFGTILLAGPATASIGTPQPTWISASEESKAFQTLATFLNLLHEKDYAGAAGLYGGK